MLFKSSLPRVKHPQEGFNNQNDKFSFYLGIARIVGYDPVTQKADIQWLTGFGDGTTGVSVAYLGSTVDSFSGKPPENGEIVLVGKSRGNFSNGFPYIVGRIPSSTLPVHLNAFVFDEFDKRYDFSFTRIPESNDPYFKSSKGSELHLTQDVFLGTSSWTKVEGISSQDVTYNTSRAFNFYGAGMWATMGLSSLPMAFHKSESSGEILSLHANEYERDASSTIDSKIKPIYLEDGTFLYVVTEDDSSKTIDESAKAYTELDYLLAEKIGPDPVSLGSFDLLEEDFLKAGEEDGHFLRFGVGTKIGKNPDDKDKYARPLRRSIYAEDSEDQLKFETDKKKLQEGLTSSTDYDKHGTSFWFNLYQKSKEIGFFEVLRSGAMRLFSGVKESDDSGNAVEADIKGRVKTSIGELEDYNPDISECSDDNFPHFKKSPKNESVIGFIKKGINLFIKDSDENETAFQLFSETGSGRLYFGKDYHLQVEGEERRLVKGKGVSTYNGDCVVRSSKNFLGLAKGVFGIQGTPISLALKPASFTDDCGGGNSSASNSSVINLGLGSSLNEDGSLSGGTVVEGTVDSLDHPTQLTIDLAGLDQILVDNFNKIIFKGNVDVGENPLDVGIEGSISTFSGSADVHSGHVLSQQLSSSLRASLGSSASSGTGDSGTATYPAL